MSHSMGHGDHDASAARCNMNMLFTWSTQDLCIIFRSWHITGPITLTISLLAIVALVAGFEALRATTARYDAALLKRRDELPHEELAETTTLLPGQQQSLRDVRAKVVRSALYGLETFYAFMIMLLFMTYNGQVMIAVGIGAFVGHLAFGGATTATRETACH
ncbi:hypothetical protein VC83_04814 [Pseudogymnoascus destructans]|uniref:Copper transport protein n=2 Tax=Pseudogymnoascus destructans TaxID=655981 RepID=L8GBD3_PSED2|nr:uncharacterized protein VC83_04814 [Pseudogymnoascus destructans]ELR10520.1 hypothetical protein GMDG_04797 [Pseudogymnoascus destructans 20631-21]OAF57254.1 hypothetical protein VC83_04814 [Pseudogymnoascus destructans]